MTVFIDKTRHPEGGTNFKLNLIIEYSDTLTVETKPNLN